MSVLLLWTIEWFPAEQEGKNLYVKTGSWFSALGGF